MNYADKAADCVLGDRNADYGNPHEDFAGIALMWSGLLNAKLKAHITAQEVALMMTALKLRREAHKTKADNVVDAHGYLLCLEWILGAESVRSIACTKEEHKAVARFLALRRAGHTGDTVSALPCHPPKQNRSAN